MADKQYYYDVENGYRIKADGTRQTDYVKIGYQESPSWEISARTVSDSVLTAVNLTEVTAWAAAVDDDYNHTSEPMIRTLDADIDSSDAVNGNIVVTLDADTSTFETAVGSESQINAIFELRGLDNTGAVVAYFRLPVLAWNTIDPSGGEPPEPTGNYYSKTECVALFLPTSTLGTLASQLTLADDGKLLAASAVAGFSNVTLDALTLWDVWHFEEVTGTADRTSAVSSYNLAAATTTTQADLTQVAGKYDYGQQTAASGSGTDAYMSADSTMQAAFNSMSSGTDWTTAIWFKTTTENAIVWAAKNDSNYAGVRLKIKATGGNVESLQGGSAEATGSFLDGAWHLAVIVVNNSAGTMAVSVDGGALASTSFIAGDNDNDYFYVGAASDLSACYTVDVDELMFFSETLDAADVTALYNSGDGRYYGGASNYDITETTVADIGKVYASSTDATAGYLDGKVDDATIEVSADVLQVKADGINDSHVDWGTGAGQVSADDVPDGASNAIITLAQETNFETAYSASHTQGTDLGLDTGGANPITAATIKGHVDSTANPHATTLQLATDSGATTTNDITVPSIFVQDDIVHDGDIDTKIALTPDGMTLQAGGKELFKLTETTNSSVVVNNGNALCDFAVLKQTAGTLLMADGSSSRVGVGTDSPDAVLHVAGTGGSGAATLLIDNNGWFGAKNSTGTQGRIFGVAGANDVLLGDIDNAFADIAFRTAGSERMRLDATGKLAFSGAGTGVSEFSTDGTLAGDSDDAVPTEKAVKTYVDDRLNSYATAYLGTPTATTITAAGTWYAIAGTFTNNFSNFSFDTDHIEYDGTETRYFMIEFHVCCEVDTNGTTVSIAVKKNTTVQTAWKMCNFAKTAGESINISGMCGVELATNDEIQLVVTNDQTGDDVTFNQFTACIRPLGA